MVHETKGRDAFCHDHSYFAHARGLEHSYSFNNNFRSCKVINFQKTENRLWKSTMQVLQYLVLCTSLLIGGEL